MVEEASSESSVMIVETVEVSKVEEKGEVNLNSDDEVKTQVSIEATVESVVQGGTESTCNNNNVAETSSLTDKSDREKSMEYAVELMDKGAKAMKEDDYSEAADCFSRALEIKVSHYGELAPECVQTYYKYGCALLYKSQEEADPFAYVPKAEGESQQSSHKDKAATSALNGESFAASVSSYAKQDESSNPQEPALDEGSTGNNLEEDGDSDDEGAIELDENESDLDLAWKMLDVARAIVEKHSGNTKEKVDILSALAEVALEREDIETSLSDYEKALSILEQLVEPDSRDIAYLNFQICLCLEVGTKTQEAIPYCQRAMSICKTRMHRLTDELKGISDSGASGAIESDHGGQQRSDASQCDDLVASRGVEIETLTNLLNDLEKKLEDLQLLASNPRSVLTEILASSTSKAVFNEKISSSAVKISSQMATAASNGDFRSPTASTAHMNASAGVTHLGVVGRGVKRVIVNSSAAESTPSKKPSLESSDKVNDGAA